MKINKRKNKPILNISTWKKQAIEVTFGFYICWMVSRFIGDAEPFVWKKLVGNFIYSALGGFTGMAGLKFIIKDYEVKSKKIKFKWWKFAIETALATIGVVLFIDFIFKDPILIKRLLWSFIVSLAAGCFFGILLQEFIFRDQSKSS
ncbi:MAG: hypothetical protein J0H55_10730 [Chitinophagaceae bacterium]|nr:hypothetical protein [Chitinophagaceae bacterium]